MHEIVISGTHVCGEPVDGAEIVQIVKERHTEAILD